MAILKKVEQIKVELNLYPAELDLLLEIMEANITAKQKGLDDYVWTREEWREDTEEELEMCQTINSQLLKYAPKE